MKTLLLILATAGLSGCAVYPAPAYEVYGGAGPPYVAPPPVYIQGGAYGTYGHGAYPQPYVYPRYYRPGYRVFPHAVPPNHGGRPNAHPVRPGHGARDRGGDGERNRPERGQNDRGGR